MSDRWRLDTLCPFAQHTLVLLQPEHKEDLVVRAQRALLGWSWWKLAQKIQANTGTVGYTTSSFRIATLFDGAPRCPSQALEPLPLLGLPGSVSDVSHPALAP